MAIYTDGNSAQIENSAFVHNLNTKGIEKAATALTDFVRIKIREASFARKILPPKPVTSTDLVQSLTTDQPMRIVEMDRLSEAYTVTFLDEKQERYYKGKKFPVYYTKVQSEEFYKPIQEIMTYRVPIKTLVQENYVKDIQIAEDAMFIGAIDSIIDTRKAAGDTDAEYQVAGPFTITILAEGMKRIIHKQVPMGTILINEMDFTDLLKSQQTSVGSAIMENIIVEGFSYTKLAGQRFIRTIKHDVVAPGTVYLFTTPEFLGVFDVLEDIKAYVEQKGSDLRFYLWETIGIAFGNVNGLVRIKLINS